jgi:hypothetical protein
MVDYDIHIIVRRMISINIFQRKRAAENYWWETSVLHSHDVYEVYEVSGTLHRNRWKLYR